MSVQSMNSMINEFNDHWNSSKKNLNESMINDVNYQREMRAKRIANQLVERFSAPNSFKFFLKCAYRMSENDIWTVYEQSHRGRINSPIRYFVASCSKRPEMQD